jgi:hypothetical protein
VTELQGHGCNLNWGGGFPINSVLFVLLSSIKFCRGGGVGGGGVISIQPFKAGEVLSI